MKKPTKPTRAKASKRPTASTPSGKSKSVAVQTKQYEAWVKKEKAKDSAYEKELTVYNKELKEYEASKAALGKLKEYKPGDSVGKSKKK